MIIFKRLSVITAVFFILTVFINPAFAGIYDATKAINDAKQNYSDFYKDYSINVPGQDQSLHYITSTGLSNLTDANGYIYGFLVYGEPHGEQKNGQYRYTGYTYYGEDFTNMDFPADKNAGGADFASQNWVSQPWSPKNIATIKASNPNFKAFPGDGDSQYHMQILAGIMAYGATNANNGFTMNGPSNTSFWDNIEQYVHILAPPTQYAWGIGRLWHYDSNGNLWYVTVPIMPTALMDQPELVVTPKTATIQVGEDLQYTATYFPKGQFNGNGQDVTNSSMWSIGDSSIATIGTNTGLATGVSPGTTEVTAAYTANGKTLQGHAELIVEEEEEEEEEPPESDYSDGGLSFQAVSQDYSTYREAGKALWTDYVTATLKLPVQTVVREGESPDYGTVVAPPRPPASECNSSHSEITGWRIVSADLSYPKQHQEFTFNHPLPPVGVETIPMEVDGQSAKATFQELWAMDGAYVYDFLNDTMINQKPKYYDITASNIVVEVSYKTVSYHEEKYRSCSGSGENRRCRTKTRCVPDEDTGTYTLRLDPITSRLLVYGTAVDSRAQ